jgi:alanine racemase
MKFSPGGRPAAALIDLDVLSGNYQAVQAAVGPERELLAVVKAEGYGHGTVESAQAFIDAGAAWLGVATVEEGEALRNALTSEDAGRYGEVRILVMSGASPELAPRIVSANLDAVVWDLNQVEALSAAGGAAGRLVRIHLKVDSGMHRLGVTPGDAPEFLRKTAALDRVEVEGLMSHLAQADEESGENPTRAQFEVILALIDDLRGQGLLPPMVHCANSAGGLVYPGAPGQLVRAGIALYGSLPAAARGVEVLPAMTLRSAVIQVKDVPAGGTVGYGGTYRRTGAGRIAVVAFGYADGYPRILSNRAEALLWGKRVPVVGIVSMDMLTVDVTDLADAQIGDEVVLLGAQGGEAVSGEELASRAHTISYEIFTGVGLRVPRIFFRDGRAVSSRLLGGGSSKPLREERGDL